jgi:hypothetical protein
MDPPQGTVANINDRLNLAPGSASGNRHPSDWNIILDGKNYFLDKPIPLARQFLQTWDHGSVAKCC